MALPIHFDKAKAERFLEGLKNGKPIDGVRTPEDMLALAGACQYLATCQGMALAQGIDWSKVPIAQAKFPDTTLAADIRAAIEYYGHLHKLVDDGEYDQEFEPIFEGVVVSEANNQIVPLAGKKSGTS